MENPLKYSLTTRFKDKFFVRYLKPKLGERVFDIGCGIGYLLSLFYSSKANLYGLDVSINSLIDAKNYIHANFICGNCQKLPFKSNSFDKIIFADVLEHVVDDENCIREIVRICKNHAKLVVSTPAIEGFITRTRFKNFLHQEENIFQKHYRNGYTAISLEKLLEDHKFKVEEIHYSNYYFVELMIIIQKFFFSLGKKDYTSQDNLVSISKTFTFKIYKLFLFPILYFFGVFEEKIFRHFLKGHCLIICSKVEK